MCIIQCAVGNTSTLCDAIFWNNWATMYISSKSLLGVLFHFDDSQISCYQGGVFKDGRLSKSTTQWTFWLFHSPWIDDYRFFYKCARLCKQEPSSLVPAKATATKIDQNTPGIVVWSNMWREQCQLNTMHDPKKRVNTANFIVHSSSRIIKYLIHVRKHVHLIFLFTVFTAHGNSCTKTTCNRHCIHHLLVGQFPIILFLFLLFLVIHKIGHDQVSVAFKRNASPAFYCPCRSLSLCLHSW